MKTMNDSKKFFASNLRVFISEVIIALCLAAIVSLTTGISSPVMFLIEFVVALSALTIISFVQIPRNHSAVVAFFGRRIYVLQEGAGLVPPIGGSYDLFEHKLHTTPIKESFFSNDDIGLELKGSLQWIPDRDPYFLRNVFLERSDEDIVKGLQDTVSSEVGSFTGTQKADDFIKKWKAIELMINCAFRLVDPFNGVSMNERLQHCIDHFEALEAELNEENKNADKRSKTEEIYGTTIIKFALADVDVDEETKKALESKKQAELKTDAAVPKLKLIKEFMAEGLDVRQALDAAEVQLGQATKQTFSGQGLTDLSAAVVAILGRRGDGGGSSVAGSPTPTPSPAPTLVVPAATIAPAKPLATTAVPKGYKPPANLASKPVPSKVLARDKKRAKDSKAKAAESAPKDPTKPFGHPLAPPSKHGGKS